MKNVLFVDDEPALLEGLRRSLYRAKHKWNMSFVDSAAQGVIELEKTPYDVIVADLRMARMDGAQLLAIASEKSPDTVRIVLSGYADERHITRLVPLAHQYLAKPCEPTRLQQMIERCIELRDRLQNPQVRAAVGRLRKIPTLPRVYASLTELLGREETSVAEVAGLIASDSAVTAKVLHVVNSAFYRHSRPITRIDQAVIHLGFGAIRNLVLSAEVFCTWPREGVPALLEPDRLQSHAQAVAAGARSLAEDLPWADDAMIAGLLHDIGYWVLLQECAADVGRAMELARRSACPLHEAEQQVLGASHADVGAYLLGLWGLPYPILEAIAFHHDPLRSAHAEFNTLAAVAVADAVIENDASAKGIDGGYLSGLGAPFDWAQAAQLITLATA